MKINESRFDSVLRITVAVLLLFLGSSNLLSNVLSIVANILGVILLLTGVIGFCPFYALLKSIQRQNKSIR